MVYIRWRERDNRWLSLADERRTNGYEHGNFSFSFISAGPTDWSLAPPISYGPTYRLQVGIITFFFIHFLIYFFLPILLSISHGWQPQLGGVDNVLEPIKLLCFFFFSYSPFCADITIFYHVSSDR